MQDAIHQFTNEPGTRTAEVCLVLATASRDTPLDPPSIGDPPQDSALMLEQSVVWAMRHSAQEGHWPTLVDIVLGEGSADRITQDWMVSHKAALDRALAPVDYVEESVED